MAHELVDPPLLSPGDRVAVISPSFAAPAHFPAIHEQAMNRLRDEFDLVPVEYASTRRDSTPAERAADLMAAFTDPEIKAVMATIGGDDQITVLPHLDAEAIRANPKRFLGYSDNTNLSNYLWHQGISSIYGGSTQVHLGPVPDQLHLDSLRAALFGGDVLLTEPERTRDFGIRWDDPRALTERAPDLPAEPWTWSGPERSVTGRTWGGCIDVLPWVLGVGAQMRPAEAYDGCVLILEASEELIPPVETYRILRVLGERGLLAAADALLWGRPPAGDHERPADAEQAASWRARQRDSVLQAMSEYAPDLVVVMDVDFGHTCPQWLLPYGGLVTVDGANRRITAHFEARTPSD
jgi:muramoyltetrapeptide carboxypeptidase LdcA involved in peptidoglycan recycling